VAMNNRKVGRLLYSVAGETELGQEKAFVIADSESEVAQYARNVLGFDVVTTIQIENDNVYV
jgi:hypothetical protein